MKQPQSLRKYIICGCVFVMMVSGWFFYTTWILHDTALIRAVGEGNVDKVRILLATGVNINERSRSLTGWTPLIVAVDANRLNLVHYLISQGADVNLPEADGKTPLICAALRGKEEIPIIKELLMHGANLDMRFP